jgi:AraC-like DNA-binding protein
MNPLLESFLQEARENLKFIEQNLDSPELNASLMAEGLSMSESQLYRKLKALSGKSTAIFIRGIRLSAAKNLLENSEFNISEIAYQCGFNEPAWFSRSFKEEFGVSPSAFRK